MKRTLVVIVAYNGLKWIDRCLGSVVSYPSELVTAFVVDNGSTDGTVEYIRKAFPSVHLIEAEENLGFGRANNIGFRYALEHGYDYVYLLNQDAWVYPDTLGSLVQTMDRNPAYGVISPLQITASGDKLDPRFAKKYPHKFSDTPSGIVEVPFVMAAHWMISRTCLETVGAFSPAFKHYGEDDNYLHRTMWHGFKVGVLHSAKAVHDRELRSETKAFRMRLKCVASVVKVSNPLNCLAWRLILQPFELLGISIRYCSAEVFKYIFTLLSDYPRLVKIRRQSKSKGAFL